MGIINKVFYRSISSRRHMSTHDRVQGTEIHCKIFEQEMYYIDTQVPCLCLTCSYALCRLDVKQIAEAYVLFHRSLMLQVLSCSAKLKMLNFTLLHAVLYTPFGENRSIN